MMEGISSFRVEHLHDEREMALVHHADHTVVRLEGQITGAFPPVILGLGAGPMRNE